MNYARIIAAAESTPWAIAPEKGRAIAHFLARKARGEDVPAAEVLAAMEKRKAKDRGPPGGVGLVPIYGTITQRADLFTEWSGGTSTDAAGRQIDQFAADPSVEAIVLDVDSPGGTVYGVEELARKIGAAGKAKKVIGVANSEAASAAYWLLSQAAEVVVTPNGQVGSIGVYLMHVDQSAFDPAVGKAVTFVSAGEKKVAGNPYGPLDAAGREEFQASVDDYYDKFVRAVARGRNTTLTAVREGFGRGGMVRAERAVREGMADRIGTLDDVLGRYGVSTADLVPAADSGRAAVEVRRRRLKLT